MGIISDKGIVMVGNFTKAKRYKNGTPVNGWNKDYKAIIKYPFKFRAKLGKVTCDCVECIESHMPYYGRTWYHSEDCAIMKHFRKYPQMASLGVQPNVIGCDE